MFFHDHLLEKWHQLSKFKDTHSFIGDDAIEDEDRVAKQIQQVLNDKENVYILFDEEITSQSTHFNVYVYDGNFLRQSFERELFIESEKLVLVCFLCALAVIVVIRQ